MYMCIYMHAHVTNVVLIHPFHTIQNIHSNDRFCNVIGCSPEELQKEDIYNYTTEGDRRVTQE